MGCEQRSSRLPDHLWPMLRQRWFILSVVVGARFEASPAPIGPDQRYF